MSKERPTFAPSSSQMATELYPNRFTAGAREYTQPGPHASKQSESGVRCRQCAYPIKDRAVAKVCPNCGSDNFEGESVSF